MAKSDKDVISVSGKAERMVFTKVLKEYAKVNKTNQWIMSLNFVGLLYRTTSVLYNFVRDNDLEKEFEVFADSLKAGYDRLFKTLREFSEQVEKLTVPLFGV